MSISLVADYDSSSDDSESYNKDKHNKTAPLTSASELLDESSTKVTTSVFSNPYREAENYEQSVLERHVKMTSPKEDVNKLRKICFKYNKGKCKLGDNCSFLHSNPHQITNQGTSIDFDVEAEYKDKKSKKRCGLKDDLVPPKKYMKSYFANK